MTVSGAPVFCVAVLLFASSFTATATSVTPPPDVRFDSVRVLDLSANPLRPGRIDGRKSGFAALAPADAAAILAAPALSEGDSGLPFGADLSKCAEDDIACLRRYEQARLKGETGVVRAGSRLTVRPTQGAPLSFADFDKPESRNADGDSARHVYLGRIGAGKLHHVEIGFGHDSPGSFLINPDNGKTVFVHNGGDIAALAPDGAHIVVFNTMNPPLSLAVASLAETGPVLELHCSATGDAADRVAQFKGWHDANSFDLVLRKSGDAPDTQALALRLVRVGAEWRLARTDPALSGALVGFACRAYVPEI
ncbi:MAG: hypothetical protein ABI411_09590 [Tahibacter sp.]